MSRTDPIKCIGRVLSDGYVGRVLSDPPISRVQKDPAYVRLAARVSLNRLDAQHYRITKSGQQMAGALTNGSLSKSKRADESIA